MKLTAAERLALSIIDSWLEIQTLRGNWPGMQVSLRRGNSSIFSQAYGFGDLRARTCVSTSSTFQVASQSKLITALVAISLHKERMLQINDFVVQYVPEIIKSRDARLKKIRIKHLLNHSAGLIRDSYVCNYWNSNDHFPKEAELLNELRATQLIFAPGSQFKYSNLGYALLGIVLERASSLSLAKLFEERVFNKLSARDKYQKRKRTLAKGYLRRFDQFVPTRKKSPSSFGGASGVVASADCMTEIVHRLFGRNSGISGVNGTELLTRPLEVGGVPDEKYGYGLIIRKEKNDILIGHSGGIPGFSSQTWCLPKSKLTIGLAFNASIPNTFGYVSAIKDLFNFAEKLTKRDDFIVSSPIYNNSGSNIYAVGAREAFGLNITSMNPLADHVRFKRVGADFQATNFSGYEATAEPVKFQNKKGKITCVSIGGSKTFPF